MGVSYLAPYAAVGDYERAQLRRWIAPPALAAMVDELRAHPERERAWLLTGSDLTAPLDSVRLLARGRVGEVCARIDDLAEFVAERPALYLHSHPPLTGCEPSSQDLAPFEVFALSHVGKAVLGLDVHGAPDGLWVMHPPRLPSHRPIPIHRTLVGLGRLTLSWRLSA